MTRPTVSFSDELFLARNLLAFSHGLDSTALFHLLLEAEVPFDLALVNYGLRPEAAEEEAAAKELAARYGKRIHLARAPRWESAFEAKARSFRYNFFETLIEEQGYDSLLTAHQLEDRLEWLLMRLRRGAGTVELAGMAAGERRRTPRGREYRLCRPLLEVSRRELLEYLERRGIRYFADGSNLSGENERSRLRPFVSAFVGEYAEGVARSFRYLERDRILLRQGWEQLAAVGSLRILRLEADAYAPRAADSVLKELGYLLTGRERERILREPSLVAGRRWAVERRSGRLFVAPYLRGLSLPRAYRERCRRAGIPPKIRPYCYRYGIEPEALAIPK
jgi:tRNA(Ile)-lysidine synthase